MGLAREPIRPVSVRDRVVEIIEQAIFAGEINPGDNVNEFRLAKELGVGTTSVREALFELERRGFIRRIPNKGAFLTEFSPSDIDQIYIVRRELEGLATELAVANQISPADLDRLRHIIEEMKIAAGHGDLPRFYDNDLAFHRTLSSLSGNRFIVQLLDIITVPLFAFYVMRSKRDPEELFTGAAAHERIVAAIEAGDPAQARRAVERSIGFFREHGRVLRK